MLKSHTQIIIQIEFQIIESKLVKLVVHVITQ